MPLFRRETSGIVADFLVDTDVFIDHLRGATEFDPKGHRVHYSVVTRAELFAGNTATELVNTLLAPFREISIGRALAERAGRVRRETDIRLPDALIAATAIEHKLSLVTRNRTDFKKVSGLRIRDIR
jgi:toxin FitB